MTIYLSAILIGVIVGLRTMAAPAALSWAAHLGVIHLEGTWLAFLGNAYTRWILTLAAIGELVRDQLPKTPSRKAPVRFGARPAGLALGAVGAVLGTLGGARVRGRLAAGFHEDRPAALIEDVVAIGGAALAMALLV